MKRYAEGGQSVPLESRITPGRGEIQRVHDIRENDLAYNCAVIMPRKQRWNLKNWFRKPQDKTVVAVRVEGDESYWLDHPDMGDKRRNEKGYYNPRVVFFEQQEDGLHSLNDMPVFKQAEDPSATWVREKDKKERLGKEQLLFSVTQVDYTDINEEYGHPAVVTKFYLAPSAKDLTQDTEPIREIRNMKDIRFTQLGDGRIAMFTRPTTGEASPGKIGFTIMDGLHIIKDEALFNQALEDANSHLLNLDLKPGEKVGTNEAHAVTVRLHGKKKEMIRVFCHKASVDDTADGEPGDWEVDPIHYTGQEFFLDPDAPNIIEPNTQKLPLPLMLIAKRDQFKGILQRTKRALFGNTRFDDIYFTGGTGHPDETIMYGGVEDAGIGVKRVLPVQEAYERFYREQLALAA